MTTKEALDLAIFAVNTLVEPSASSPEDWDTLLDNADAVIDVLDALRRSLHDGA